MTMAAFERKHFGGAGLQLRGLIHFHHGKSGAGEEAESSTARSVGSRERRLV